MVAARLLVKMLTIDGRLKQLRFRQLGEIILPIEFVAGPIVEGLYHRLKGHLVTKQGVRHRSGNALL